jgi:hypothetical protein
MTGRARKAESQDKPMVTLINTADGQEFSTGNLATVNSLLVNGYRLKSGTVEDVQETLAPTPGDQGTGATP